MKRVIKILGLTGASLLLLFAVALLVFYHLIQIGEFRRFLNQEGVRFRSVTPTPLSTLSEFFYAALAIPKGVIGLPREEKK